MSASNEWTEWHLTPRGWERGTEKSDYGRVERDPPEDRVQTVVWTEHLSHIMSKQLDKGHQDQWQCEDAGLVAQLRAQFGAPPTEL